MVIILSFFLCFWLFLHICFFFFFLSLSTSCLFSCVHARIRHSIFPNVRLCSLSYKKKLKLCPNSIAERDTMNYSRLGPISCGGEESCSVDMTSGPHPVPNPSGWGAFCRKRRNRGTGQHIGNCICTYVI